MHTHSHLILGATLGVGPSQDSPDFNPAVRQATALAGINTALADRVTVSSTTTASAARNSASGGR